MKKINWLVAIALLTGTTAFVLKDKPKGVDVLAMDKNVKPQSDFYLFANGNWIKQNPIPTTEARWSAFNIVSDRNNETLKSILENAAKNPSPSTHSEMLLKVFYNNAMNEAALNNQRFKDLFAIIRGIQGINTTNELMVKIADLHKIGVPAAFGFDFSQDVKNSMEYAAYLSQGGLGLPDKDYYSKTDQRTENIKMAYINTINSMMRYLDADMQRVGEGNLKIDGDLAKGIMALESRLATFAMSRVEMRDMEKMYNPFSTEGLSQKYANLYFDQYFNRIGIEYGRLNSLVVMQPTYFSGLNELVVTNLPAWKNYLIWTLLRTTAPYLHDEMVKLHFDFYGTALTGAKEQKPRWKRVINQANSLIGEVLGQEFVKLAFTPQSKQKVNELVDNLSKAFKIRIENLDWMSAETKNQALGKLASFTRKLGYPDKWTDFSEFRLGHNSFVGNYFEASTFWFNKNLKRMGQRVDRTEWEMLPQTVNAYYNPVNNEIVFPAAIMQPPFFTPGADDAINYGSIGAVIGHEFSHGFDDEGSKYDAEGNLNDWWTAQDRALFEERTQKLVKQFSAYQVLDSVYINGQLTLGENIADLAGLTVAYEAYQISLKGKKRKKIDGYTPEQRFFIGFGQVWRGHATESFLRQQVVTDPHSPAKFRVLGTLSNMPEFYKAFKVKPTDGMWRDEKDRVKIW